MERICSPRSKFFPLRVEPILEGFHKKNVSLHKKWLKNGDLPIHIICWKFLTSTDIYKPYVETKFLSD